MADETIQDDHPVITPVSVPKPGREPVTIEGTAVDVTPADAKSPESKLEVETPPASAPVMAEEAALASTEPSVETAPTPELVEVAAEAAHGNEPGSAAEEAASEHEPGAAEAEPSSEHEPVSAAEEPASEHEPVVAEPEPAPIDAALEPHAEPKPVVASTEAAPSKAESAPAASPSATSPPSKPSSAAAFVSGGVGALLGAAVAFGATFVFPPGSNNSDALTARLTALDSSQSNEASARKALDARLAALEAKTAQPVATSQVSDLEARLAKLEGSFVKADALAAVAAEAKAAHVSADNLAAAVASLGPAGAAGASGSGPNPEIVKLIADQQALAGRLSKLEPQLAAVANAAKLAGDQQALADRVAKLQTAIEGVKTSPGPDPAVAKLAGDQQAIADRLGKLEAAVNAPKVPPTPDPLLVKLTGDETALSDRLAKLEASLVATKAEIRADREVGPKGDPVAQSVAAIALERRLLAGQPYAVEFAALEKLGAAADALAALKPYAAAGAPTTSALAASFAQLAPALAAPEKAAAHGDYAQTLWGEVKGLVKVHQVGEIKGDDPAAVTTQVAGALARGDLGAARAAFAKLPEAARASASSWSKDADGVAAARSAALSLVETSLGHIGDQKK